MPRTPTPKLLRISPSTRGEPEQGLNKYFYIYSFLSKAFTSARIEGSGEVRVDIVKLNKYVFLYKFHEGKSYNRL